MTSIADVCNRALSEIGARANLASLADPTPQANACALWYDRLRRKLLRAAPWGMSRATLSLTELGDLIDGTSPFPMLYKYAYPSDCIKMRYLLCAPPIYTNTVAPSVGTPQYYNFLRPSRSQRYLVANDMDAEGNQSKVILSNVYQAIGVYNRDVQDPDLFDDGFEEALVASLAAKIIMPLTGNVGMKAQYEQLADLEIIKARSMDANESITKSDHTPDWITGRGTIGWGQGAFPWGSLYSWGDWNCSWEDMGWSS